MAFGRLKVDELETSTQVVDIDSLAGANGTVTSVGLTAPTGFSVSGSPVTTSGNITLSFAAGYSLPTTASQTNWDTAYSERLYWDGGATGLNAATGRTSLGLATVAATGDYSDLTGTPSIPAAADATPQPLGAAAIGASTDYAREDHVHAMPSAADVGADASGTAASAISTHEAAADPHPGYALESSLGGAALLDVGTTTGTVAAGDDSRFTTDLTYTASTRVLASSTGADATLPLFTSTDAGLAPSSGGGTTNFLRADGTWAAPASGGTPGGTSGQLQWNSSGSFAGVGGSTVGATGDITLSLNGAASTPPLKLTGTWFTGGTATTTKPQVLIEPSGTTSTAWSTSGTGLGINAASGFAGNLLDLQVGGASKFQVDSSGNLTVGASPYATVNARYINCIYGGARLSTGVIVGPAGSFRFANSGALTTADVYLYRDAADTLAQRNGTNAQTYRLYNTYTDASNYERAKLSWNSNVFEIGTEGAGTGSEQPVRITAATLKLPNLPTYADNAAATAGGLVAGDVYKTATGELRITV